MRFNIYYFIFYVLYKFSWLADKKETRPEIIVQSAYLSLTACVFLILLSISKILNLWSLILLPRFGDFLFWGFILFLIYFINGRIFIKDEKYLEIAKSFDGKIKLSKSSTIAIALFILFCNGLSFFIAITK